MKLSVSVFVPGLIGMALKLAPRDGIFSCVPSPSLTEDPNESFIELLSESEG